MNISYKTWKWYWIPITVCLIGILSIILFFAIHRIRVHQRENTTLNNAILHVQVDTAIFHLHIEEYMAGETTVNLKDTMARLDHVIDLVNVIGSDGVIDPDEESVAVIVRRLGLQGRTEELKSQLKALRNMAHWRLEDIATRGVGSDSDSQFDVLFDEIVEKAAAIEAVCKASRKEDLRTSRKLVLSIYLIWSFFLIIATTGIWRVELLRKNAEEELRETNSRLIIQTEELATHRENLAGLVEKRTSELMNANVLLRHEIDNRLKAEETLKESEEQIRALSAQLLRAQEIERRRISMELHDNLGQALNVIKLRLRIVENWLSDEQVTAREDCESLQEYLGEVIEEVRRLSWDLSPAILEDLGLTSALRWLVSNFRTLYAMKTTAEITEIDDLFPENNRIIIYRVIQEALANVGRHSRAKNVSVVIRRDQDRVAFTVEDDGKGFDSDGSLNREDSKTGLGLKTMNERVRMMGGDFDLWSREGEGTRINFSVSIGSGGGSNG